MLKPRALWSILLVVGIASSGYTQTEILPTIASAPGETEPLGVGESMPDVTIFDAGGMPVTLSSLHEEGPVVLVFFRGGWCPICTKHTQDLIKAYPQIQQLGAKLVGISPDSPASATENVDKRAIPFPILSDAQLAAIGAFGLAFQVDEATVAKYKSFGIDLEQASGESHRALPIPAVYIVAPSGEIVFAHSDADYRRRLDAKLILRELQKR